MLGQVIYYIGLANHRIFPLKPITAPRPKVVVGYREGEHGSFDER